MNNTELIHLAERNWIEANLLTSKNIRVKRPARKYMWDVLNSFSSLLNMELFYNKQIL
jgi:hypothetical protein